MSLQSRIADLITAIGTDVKSLDTRVDVLELAPGGGVTDHGALTGLTDDDHEQYELASENLLPTNVAADWVAISNCTISTENEPVFGIPSVTITITANGTATFSLKNGLDGIPIPARGVLATGSFWFTFSQAGNTVSCSKYIYNSSGAQVSFGALPAFSSVVGKIKVYTTSIEYSNSGNPSFGSVRFTVTGNAGHKVHILNRSLWFGIGGYVQPNGTVLDQALMSFPYMNEMVDTGLFMFTDSNIGPTKILPAGQTSDVGKFLTKIGSGDFSSEWRIPPTKGTFVVGSDVPITAGVKKAYWSVPFTGTITKWKIISDLDTLSQISVLKAPFHVDPTFAAIGTASISGGHTATGTPSWAVTAGDILDIEVLVNNNAKKLVLELTIT